MSDTPDIIVSGHLCIDLIPGMAGVSAAAMSTPGHLSETGPLVVSTGGAVSNVGLTLYRLGVDVGLMASVGDDLLGQMIVGYLRGHSPDLARMIRVRPGQPSSYTVVLSPENRDRMFLHCPATNDTFGHEDIDFDLVRRARIFHLGYPALMARLRADGGAELETIFARAKATGVVTSLDQARPDPDGPGGRADWPAIVRAALPHVDLFVPSIEEILFMLRRADYDAWGGNVRGRLTRAYLHALAGELLDMGVAVAGFKLGEVGLYLRAAGRERLEGLARLPLDAGAWADAQVYQPAFLVEVAGTTGAGDSAYAGLLAALLRGLGPADAARMAAAVGACNVERPDSNSGIRPWAETQARVAAGWPLRPERLAE